MSSSWEKTSRTAVTIISISRMRSVLKTYISVLACLLVLGCTPETLRVDDDSKVQMTLDPGSLQTRAHFEDKGSQAKFVWDVGGSMIAIASDGSSLVQWSSQAYYSPMHISLIDPSNKHKVLRAISSLSLPSDGLQTYNPLYFFSPVEGNSLCSVESEASSVGVDFSMPSLFSQSGSGKLEEFEPYCYIRGESKVLSTPSKSDKNFSAASTVFKAIPATFRFNISNLTNTDITLESVKISCNRLFPDRLIYRATPEGVSISEPKDKSGYFSTIKTSIASGYGETIKAKDGGNISTGSYYSMCLPFDSDDSMQGATLAFILESSEKTYTFNIPAEAFFRNSTSAKSFEGGKLYTFNFSAGENSVELEGVSISDWITDPFNTPTELISEDVRFCVSFWVQNRENLYTFSFTRMIGDADSHTLWSECNIGEYINTSTDITLSWTMVTPAYESDTNYLSQYFDNITDFKWQTPSREDYERLLNANNTVTSIEYEHEARVHGLRIKRKDDEDISLFIPCSENVETHTEYPDAGTTVTTRTYRGNYWTRDEADEDNGFVFHFAFRQVETVKGEISTFSDYSPVLNEGADLYEFKAESKIKPHPVKAIIQHDR